MNLYLSIFLIIILTLTVFFLCMSESAVIAANISRIKQLEDDGSKKAANLAMLLSGNKSYFIALIRTVNAFCLFGISLLTINGVNPRVVKLFDS